MIIPLNYELTEGYLRCICMLFIVQVYCPELLRLLRLISGEEVVIDYKVIKCLLDSHCDKLRANVFLRKIIKTGGPGWIAIKD